MARRPTSRQSTWVPPDAWPTSDDVGDWMNALLSLTPQMKQDERTSSTVIVAIGELAGVGRVNEALAWVEQLLGTVAAEGGFERAHLLETAADIAHDAGRLAEMEAYLQRILALQPLFKRKCDSGCTQRRVDGFLIRRGLLEPSRAATPEDRTDAEFNQLIRLATLPDARSPCELLRKAAAMIATMEPSAKRWRKRSVLRAAHDIGCRDLIRDILAAEVLEPSERRVSGADLLAIGEKDRALAALRAEAEEDLRELDAGGMNTHFPAMGFERAIRNLVNGGFVGEAESLLAKALREGATWWLPAPGAFASAVFASMAKAVASVRGNSAALELVNLAMATANADQPSNWKAAAVRANAELLIELSPLSESLKIAKSIRSPTIKRKLMASHYARIKAWGELHALLNQSKTAMEAAEVIWSTKFVWRPAK